MGAGKPEAARATLHAVLALSVTEFLAVGFAIGSSGHVLGYTFSRDQQVISYVKKMAPFLGMSIVMDGIQAVLSGVVRGIGLQHIGAYVNAGAYYLVCIPVALLFGFLVHLKGVGLWSGLVAGATVQSIALSLLTASTNWEKKAIEVRQRIFSEEFQVGNDAISKHEIEKLVEML